MTGAVSAIGGWTLLGLVGLGVILGAGRAATYRRGRRVRRVRVDRSQPSHEVAQQWEVDKGPNPTS
jgi:hypothetical protein